MYFFDEINLSSALIIKNIDKKEVIYSIREINGLSKILVCLLRLLKYKVVEVEFYLGHLKKDEDTGLIYYCLDVTKKLSQRLADLIYKKINTKNLTSNGKRDSVKLLLLKEANKKIYSDILMIELFLKFKNSKDSVLYLACPGENARDILSEKYKNIKFIFYKNNINLIKININLITSIALNIVFKNLSIIYFYRFKKYPLTKESVLTLQCDTLRRNKDLRGQPHWIDFNLKNNKFTLYILEVFGDNYSKKNVFKNGLDNVSIISKKIFGIAYFKNIRNESINNVNKLINKFYLDLFSNSCEINFYLLKIIFFLVQARYISALAIYLNSKVFLCSDPIHVYADSVVFSANELGIETLGYQYSNLGSVSPLMITNYDKFLLFSEQYKEIFKYSNIGPREFKSIGYVFDNSFELIKQRASGYRDDFKKKGASFVICYFDERVDISKWGVVNQKSHLEELEKLLVFMFDNPDVAVIVKSQFVRYTPSVWYKNHLIFSRALKTGRYKELNSGDIGRRNDSLPCEAAYASDICISQKFGATAALEAALIGSRAVLLNSVGYKTEFDHLYKNLEYKSIETLLDNILIYKKGELNNFGDWTAIIEKFDNSRDGKAAKRIFHEVEKGLGELNMEKKFG